MNASDDHIRVVDDDTEIRQLLKTYDQLLDLTQGRDTGPFDRSIDVLIGRLRRRLSDDAREPTLIKTVRGRGYLFASKVTPRR